MNSDNVVDLAEDKVRLDALYGDLLARLSLTTKQLSLDSAGYYPRTHAVLQEECLRVAQEIQDVRDSLQKCEFLLVHKQEFGDLLRVFDARVAACITAPNWQSPSFWHNGMSQAGTELGVVSASNNDYKRDMHVHEKNYGSSFVKAYVDHPLRLAPFAFATNSGMSATATVLTRLRASMQGEGVVLAGKSSYFQNKWQLEHLFPGRVCYVDEFDTDNIIALAKELQPSIVFLDSLCNTASLPMPHLAMLVPALSEVLSNKSTLVIDNTILTTMYQPLCDLPMHIFGMKLVVVESLLKYHQFGLDRVSGGIIWAPVGSEGGLFDARMHMGTIMADTSVHALPTPNRALLDARLMRMGRNAKILAQQLHEYTQGSGMVVHPSLPQYEGRAWAHKMSFQGPFVTFKFKEGEQDVRHCDAFVARVRKAAQSAGVRLVGGTSFGFDVSRLYVTARYATNITKPFVRVAVGTETKQEIDALVDVFKSALV